MLRNRRFMILAILLGIVILYGILLIPDSTPPLPPKPEGEPFVWNQDAIWENLESSFLQAKAVGCKTIAPQLDQQLAVFEELLDSLKDRRLAADDPRLRQLEQAVFAIAPSVAVCYDRLPDFSRHCAQLRSWLKQQSIYWDIANNQQARIALYRLLYGSRAALEEVMLQAPPERVQPLLAGEGISSQSPMASILGVKIHSGDILLSRGGAATSALIARGNNFPGNFSHVALAHVDETTHTASIIEAHIESGVKVADLETYLKDKKLRILVLRTRPDLKSVQVNPLLPHQAARQALDDADQRHIPYDFAMDWQDPDKQFCSEVASTVYAKNGIDLWMGISTISAPGLLRWLSLIGVEHFETHEPSDLEYDPQLSVVAEWRDPETLYQDHVDNATIDVMLEGADAGQGLPFSIWMLPVGRLAKGYSMLLNMFGKVGPIPEGMSASTALRVQSFTDRHQQVRDRVYLLAEEFQAEYGYRPPYWELVKLARVAINESL
ncbi:MAG: YiiX/YebB-like N1pC/P60 family cysteine hydrolase [Bacteroidota bacterium]